VNEDWPDTARVQFCAKFRDVTDRPAAERTAKVPEKDQKDGRLMNQIEKAGASLGVDRGERHGNIVRGTGSHCHLNATSSAIAAESGYFRCPFSSSITIFN
jgi:hypothetical protein